MKKITLETIENDVREFLTKKKRRPFILLIKAIMIAVINSGIYFAWTWLLARKIVTDDSSLFYFLGVGGTLFVMIMPLELKIPVKIRPTEINELLPHFFTVNMERLAGERNKLYDLVEYYEDKVSETEGELTEANANLKELDEIEKAFKKAQNIE